MNSVASRKRDRFGWVKGYLHISPSILGFCIFVAYPLVMSVYYALTKWDGYNKPEYVGFDNFNYLFTVDPVFWKALRITFYYVLVNVPASLIGGLLLAMLLNKNLPGIKFFRTAFYLPTVLPMIATLTLWKFIYQPQYGLANRVLHLFGADPVNWLSDERLALFSVIIAGLWQIGGGMIIFLSGLQSIPQDLYEASSMDGAKGWAVFRNVTLPLIAPILFLQLILGIIGAFQSFAQVQVMTGGGPNYATELLNFKIYSDVFGSKMFGYGIAEVWILFLIIMFFTLITFRFSNQFVHYENDNR